jgi:hypothetical protein
VETQHPPPFGMAFEIGRLSQVAGLVREARDGAVKQAYTPQLGDGPWGVGCLAYERIVNRIIRATRENRFAPWLSIIEPPLHFVFGIDGVPLRFFRGSVERRAPKGQLLRRDPELRAYQISLIQELYPEATDPRVYRIMYETWPDTLLVRRVLLVALDDDRKVVGAWSIPGDGDEGFGGIAPFGRPEPPVDLEPVDLKLVKEIEEAEEEELRREEESG